MGYQRNVRSIRVSILGSVRSHSTNAWDGDIVEEDEVLASYAAWVGAYTTD